MPVASSGVCLWVGCGGWETALWATTPTASLVWAIAVCHLGKPSWGHEWVCGSLLGGGSLWSPPPEAGSPCAGTCICKGRAQVLTHHVGLHPWGPEGFRQGCAPRICPRAWSGRRKEGGCCGDRAAGCCLQLSPDVGASPKAANPNCGD